jgi:coenzyme F420-reducing hydrogenase alpha subunit
MSQTVHINTHHVTRIEGHGNIVVNVSKGIIEKCEWQVPEAPRFFESMVRGRHYTEVARIVSRICGICAIGHTLASLKATEDALGIIVTPQTVKLRELIKHAEIFDSHIAHLLFLVAPDLLVAPSILPLIPTHTETIRQALRLKNFGHEIGSLVGGRTTHPTRLVPGGFAAFPQQEEVVRIKQRLENEVMPDLTGIIGTLLTVADRIPKFVRPTEFIALKPKTQYGFYDGDIHSVMPDGSQESWPVSAYQQVTHERVVATSTAKHCSNKMASYMVGALARFNNNYEALHPEAKEVAAQLGLEPLCSNPYLNNAAQAVELTHSIHACHSLLDELARQGIRQEPLMTPVKYGKGFGAVEVPRGVLFHSYVYDQNHICQGGDFVIPTNQNHGNIQCDFDKLVPELIAKNLNEHEMELQLEMLVRAYDPCISCSTHFLDVTFVR